MAKKLTAGVLNGTKHREIVTVEWQGEEYEVEIKPLNNDESIQVEELMQEGVKFKAKPGIKGKMTRQMDFDTKENFRGRRNGNIKAVALGTTDNEITEKVVKEEFAPPLIEEIAEHVKRISGIGNQDEVEEQIEDEADSPSDGEQK